MEYILLGCQCTENFIKAFEKKGYGVCKAEKIMTRLEVNEIDDIIKKKMKDENIKYLFTYGFWPNISKVCYENEIKYLCWVWDAPHSVLWAKEARLSTNYIFVFDYSQYQVQKERGINNVFYLPLAADEELFSDIIERDCGKHKEKYGADVCFMGNFYNDSAHDIYDQIQYIPPYAKGYLEGLINAQKKVWGADLLANSISDSVWKMLKDYILFEVDNRYEEGYFESTIQNILGQKIAQLERMEMCSELNKRFKFALYSDCDTSFDANIKNRGHADYAKEMPLIFHYSKINIHMTIRSIPTGVALRVFDVLASGGFLLTNYQAEIAEYFVDGEELVIYNDLEDLYEKINYYLKHEEERKAIAEAGHRKVKELFSYEKQIGIISEVLEQYEENSNHI